MNPFRKFLFTISAISVLFISSANASLLVWDFTVKVDTIYRDNANVIDDSYVTGSTFTGSFSYNSNLTDDSPTNTYLDSYLDPTGTITVDGLGIYNWDLSVSVVHQGSRDIVDVNGDYYSGNISESVEIGFLDYTQSYANGALPLNWHTPPTTFTDIDFDYTYNLGTDPCCYDSWLSGHITNISLRPTQNVPEPSNILLLSFVLIGLARKAITKNLN